MFMPVLYDCYSWTQFKVFAIHDVQTQVFFVTLRGNTVNRKTKMHLDMSDMIKKMFTYVGMTFERDIVFQAEI